MLEIAFAIAIFSYGIFFLGLLGFLYPPLVMGFTILYGVVFFIWRRNAFLGYFLRIARKKVSVPVAIGIFYIVLQACINCIGLFGPEISFDSLWYHLTLPKLYLFYHSVIHFPGGVLYYSGLPHLTEMLYVAGLSFGSDFWARGIHFLFGLLTCIAIYKVGRKFFTPQWAIPLPVIFYSSLVVGWESISGYIDLSRTFFTVSALYSFLTWTETKEKKWFVSSAFLVGLTISTKLLAFPDVVTYAAALLFFERNRLLLTSRFKRIISFVGIALIPVLPWLIFSYVHTGNPVYPTFSSSYEIKGYWWDVLNPLSLPRFIWDTFAKASDPIHPLFLAMLPFIIIFWKKIYREIPLLLLFAIGGFAIWYFTPQTGGGRYILPYVPIFSLLCIFIIQKLSKKWQLLFFAFIIFVATISLVYRFGAVAKFIPVITGRESRAHFFETHLQFNLGDFYDIDGYFSKHIKQTDKVLLYGFHNLYYVNFPYILSDWAQEGDTFNYVAVQGLGMPERFAFWNLIYFNTKTQVRLYSLAGKTWRY